VHEIARDTTCLHSGGGNGMGTWLVFGGRVAS
jgi:hypothetical protein